MKAPPDESAWEALVPTIGEDRLQARHLPENALQQERGHLTVMLICRMNKHAKEKPNRIDDYVPFPALDLFAWVRSSLRASLPSGIDRLGVNTEGFLGCRAGTGPAPLSHAGSPPDQVAELLKDLMDEVLKASSQPEAWQIFEEILDGDRQKMVSVATEEGQTEEIDAYRKLREQAAPALATLKENLEDATAVLALPAKYRRRLRTTNMIERLIEEVRRREKVIRIFPNMGSTWRPIGAVLAERHEEWSTGRKYLDMDEFRNWKEQAHRPEPEPDESPERQPVMAT